jgi:hypothetical protein
MDWLSVLVLLFIALAVVGVIAKRLTTAKRERAAWTCKPRRVLTDPEQVLFHRLREAMPECIVLAQVELSRVVVPTDPDKRNAFALYNRIRGKSLDFVVCLKDFSVVAALELDDASHTKSRRAADETKNQALTSAGIPLIRWNVRSLPTSLQIQTALKR